MSAYNAYKVEAPGSIPGSGRYPGEGNGNPLQYSCLENPMDGGAWEATVHEVEKSRTRLSDFTFTFFHFFRKMKKPKTSHWGVDSLLRRKKSPLPGPQHHPGQSVEKSTSLRPNEKKQINILHLCQNCSYNLEILIFLKHYWRYTTISNFCENFWFQLSMTMSELEFL